MGLWMWFLIVTWPIAGITALEFVLWMDRSEFHYPPMPIKKHICLGFLSSLIGWLLVVFVLIASFDDMQG